MAEAHRITKRIQRRSQPDCVMAVTLRVSEREVRRYARETFYPPYEIERIAETCPHVEQRIEVAA